MADRVLITVNNMFIKSIILKNLHAKGFEIIEASDEADLFLKLDIYRESIMYYIIQVNADTYEKQYDMVKRIRQEEYFRNLPIMAIVPDVSKEFISGAKDADINDVFPVPSRRELLKDYLPERLSAFITKIPSGDSEYMNKIKESIMSDLGTNSELKNEIKRASRGKYPVSFVMGRISGFHIGLVQEFYDKLSQQMRETDRIVNHDYRTFIIACPFTMKKNVVEIERKIRGMFDNMFKGTGKLHMYSVTYPDDGDSLERLVEIMEKGVHGSIVISGIRQPLNTLSKDKLEEFRNMLKLYK